MDDPRKEDPPWLALIQQLVDGYTFRKHYVRLLDLYLWAVASGRPPMAAALWRRCKHPLRAALIGQERLALALTLALALALLFL